MNRVPVSVRNAEAELSKYPQLLSRIRHFRNSSCWRDYEAAKRTLQALKLDYSLIKEITDFINV